MLTSSGPQIYGFLEEREVCIKTVPLRICDDNFVGVFGGQVISQAIVAATQTVDRAFHLHVRALFLCYFNAHLFQ